MKKGNYIIISALIIIGTIAVSCGSKGSAGEEAAVSTDSVKIQVVRTEILKKQEIKRTLDYTANIIPFEELYMAPATPGRVQKVYVEVGDRVAAGQLIAEMDPTQLNQVKLQLLSLEKDFERMDTLLSVGGIAQQQYDQVKTQLDVTRSNVAFMEENTFLRAPFSGIVTAKYFENGELYSGAPNTQAGKAAIVTLQQIQPVKAMVNVSEKYFPVLKENMQVVVMLDIYPNEDFEGTIYRIYPTISSMTRTFQVEVKINNTDLRIRPGMFARVEIELGNEETMIVPVSTVLRQTGTNKKYLFVYEDGFARKVTVEQGKRFDEKIEVISEDIVEGSEIIIAGHNNLIDGDPVELIK